MKLSLTTAAILIASAALAEGKSHLRRHGVTEHEKVLKGANYNYVSERASHHPGMTYGGPGYDGGGGGSMRKYGGEKRMKKGPGFGRPGMKTRGPGYGRPGMKEKGSHYNGGGGKGRYGYENNPGTQHQATHYHPHYDDGYDGGGGGPYGYRNNPGTQHQATHYHPHYDDGYDGGGGGPYGYRNNPGTQHQATHFGRHHGHEGHGRNGGGGGGGGGGCRTYTRGNVSATCCNGVTWYGNTPVCVGDDEEDSASTDYDYEEDASADQYYAEE